MQKNILCYHFYSRGFTKPYGMSCHFFILNEEECPRFYYECTGLWVQRSPGEWEVLYMWNVKRSIFLLYIYTVVHERPKTSVEVCIIPIKIPDPRPLTCPSTAYSKSHVWFVLEKMLQHGQSPPPPPPPPPSYIPETHEYLLAVKKNRRRTDETDPYHDRPQRVSHRGTGKVVTVFPILGGGYLQYFVCSLWCTLSQIQNCSFIPTSPPPPPENTVHRL